MMLDAFCLLLLHYIRNKRSAYQIIRRREHSIQKDPSPINKKREARHRNNNITLIKPLKSPKHPPNLDHSRSLPPTNHLQTHRSSPETSPNPLPTLPPNLHLRATPKNSSAKNCTPRPPRRHNAHPPRRSLLFGCVAADSQLLQSKPQLAHEFSICSF